MKEITVKELKEMRDKAQAHQLIDVREEKEFNFCNLGGELFPLGQILDYADQISKDQPVIVHCRSGKRSADAIELLERKFGFTNLYNLKGGILAWSDEIDPEVPKY